MMTNILSTRETILTLAWRCVTANLTLIPMSMAGSEGRHARNALMEQAFGAEGV